MYNQFTPHYSLYDLFTDLLNGTKETFNYNDNTFKVSKEGGLICVTDTLTGYKAKQSIFSVRAMLDLQGAASCLLEYKKDLIFDKEGNIIN